MTETTLQSFFSLRTMAPFRLLDEETLLLVAGMTEHKVYAAGQMVAPAGESLRYALFVTQGRFTGHQLSSLPACWNLPGLLRGEPLDTPLIAGEDGVHLWRIPRAQMLVLLREAPSLLLDALQAKYELPSEPSPQG